MASLWKGGEWKGRRCELRTGGCVEREERGQRERAREREVGVKKGKRYAEYPVCESVERNKKQKRKRSVRIVPVPDDLSVVDEGSVRPLMCGGGRMKRCIPTDGVRCHAIP